MQTLRPLRQLLLTMEIGALQNSYLLLSHLPVFSMDDHLMVERWPSSQQLKPIMLYIFAPKAQGNQHSCQLLHRVYRKRLLRTEHMLHHSIHLVSTALDTFRFSICGPFLLFPHQSICPCFHRVISCRGPAILFQVLSTFLVGLNMP